MPKYTQLNFAQNKIKALTLTSHPTKVGLKKPIDLITEIEMYARTMKDFIPYYSQNPETHIDKLQTWVGFDCDRHPQEQAGIFTFSTLTHLKYTLMGYCTIDDIKKECEEDVLKIAKSIDIICKSISNNFRERVNNKNIKELGVFDSLLQKQMEEVFSLAKPLQTKIQDICNSSKNTKLANTFKLLNVFGPHGQYRISGTDLQSTESRKKIEDRLLEAKQLTGIFGVSPISEVIIADFSGINDKTALQKIIDKVKIKISITPLIEKFLDKKVTTLSQLEETTKKQMSELKEVIKLSDKIMVAGSDSVQRDTFVGALLLKLNIQLLVMDENKKRKDYNKVTFYDGVGSTANRSGCRTNTTVCDEISPYYERTVQGQQQYVFATDPEYQEEFLLKEVSLPNCTRQDIENAIPLLQKLFLQLSTKHINLQSEPSYTQHFKVEKIAEIVNKKIPLGGSRAKEIDVNNFFIKDARAITQSFIHNSIGFQPELMYWGELSKEMMKEIKNNISNPIINTLVEHYKQMFKQCNLETASDFIKDSGLKRQFANSYFAFQNFAFNDIAKIDIKQFANNQAPTKYCKDDIQYLPKLNFNIFGARGRCFAEYLQHQNPNTTPADVKLYLQTRKVGLG